MVFPKPIPTYDKTHPFLYYIPKRNPKSNKDKIPVLFYSNKEKCKRLLIYFHGNAEDACCSMTMIITLCDEIDVN